MSASLKESISRFHVRAISVFVGLAVLSGLLTNLPASAQTAADVVVMSPTAVAAGWRVVVKDNFVDWSNGTAPANGGITFAPNSENAMRVFGPGAGFGSVEVTFGSSMVGKTIELAPWDATVSAPIAGAAVSALVNSSGKAVFSLPSSPFGLLYFTGINAASITITGIVAKTGAAQATTTNPATTLAGGTTTVASSPTTTTTTGQGDVAVVSPTAVAAGWRLVVDANFNGVSPANGGVTFTPNSEAAFRLFGPGAGFRSVEVTFGSSMVGKTVGLAPWDSAVAAAISGSSATATVDATGKATFALPSTAFGMLYFTGVNAGTITITNVNLKIAGTAPPTTVVGGGQADLAILTPTAVTPGWRVVVDANFNGATPANGGITFPANSENAFRVFGTGTGFRSVEVTFGSSMVGKTVGLAPWDATVTAAISGSSVTATVDATGKAIFALPATPFGMLYFTGVNAASVTLLGITAKSAAVGGPPTTVVGGQLDVAVMTPTVVAPGWRVVVDANFNGATPANGGITFAANSENAFRIFGPGTGFRSVEVTFGSSMVGKSIGLAPWDASVTAAISGASVTATVDATGKAVFALPTTPFGMLYVTGVNAASVTLTGITAKVAVVAGPTTTVPGTQTNLAVVTTTTVASGWRVVVDANFNGVSPANGGITFSANTENAFRLFGPATGFGSVEVTFGSSMVGKTVGLAPWDATVSAPIGGAGVSGVVDATGKVVFALPTTPAGMLYFTGVNAASVTITGITLRSGGTVPGGGTGPGGGLVSPNPCPGRSGALRIWPIGDSLTVGGYGTGDYAGATPFRDSYRYELFRLLGVNGFSNVQFRGDLGRAGGWGGNLPAGVSDEFSHSGYGGRDIPFMIDNVSTLALVGPVDPDLIVLNIGHNGGTPDQLTALVARLQQIAPYAVIVIGGLAQSRLEISGPIASERTALQAKAQALGAISATDRVLFANVFAGMQQQGMVNGDYADDVHYNVSGGTKFAAALLPTVLAGLTMVSGARCTSHATLVDGGTPVTPGTQLLVDVNIVQTSPIAYAPGFTSQPTLSSTTVPAVVTINGPAVPGARALRVDMNSTLPVRVQVDTQDGTRSYADFTVLAGNTIHSIPFTTPLGASPVRVTLTATGTYTLRAVTLVGRPFVTVSTNPTYAAGVSVPVTISGVWDPGVTGRTLLRVQAATDPNSCLNCGVVVSISGAGQSFFNTLTPGIYKAVLYTNTPGEVIGISSDFEVLPEVAVPTGTQITAYDDRLSDAFRNWSWAIHNLDNTTPAFGEKSISFEADNWKGLTFHADQLGVAARSLSIQINGGTVGGQAILVAVTSNQQTIASRQLVLIAGWQPVTLTFPAPVAAGSPIEVSVSSQSGNDQPTVYLDEIKIGTGGTPPPTTTPGGTLPPTTAAATTTRPPTTAVPTTAGPTTRPATTLAATTTRPATTAVATTRPTTTAVPTTGPATTRTATTTRPLTTLAPTTLAPTTTRLVTTTVATTTAPTTLAPQPPYAGLDQEIYGAAALTSACYTGGSVVFAGLSIPAEAWNGGVIRAAGNGYFELTATPTYILGGVSGTSTAAGYTYTPGVGPSWNLPPIPVGSVVIGYTAVFLRACISDPSQTLKAYINLPSTNGTVVTTSPPPPVTGTPTTIVGTPTTTPVTPGTTVPADGRPAPFMSPINYLRSKFFDTTINAQPCLAQTGQPRVGMGVCGPSTGLSFASALNNTYRINPALAPQTCLQFGGYQSPATDATSGRERNVLAAEWGRCDVPNNTAFTNFDNRFNMILQPDGWYTIKPVVNYAGWDDPCLAANALIGTANPGNTSGNTVGSPTPVVQFTCLGPAPDWQQWAPAERDWTPGTPPPCTTNCPQPPNGAKLLTELVPTKLERKNDLACLSFQSGLYQYDLTRSQCDEFVPILVTGGYHLRIFDPLLLVGETCLSSTGSLLTRAECSDSTIWDDRPVQQDGLSFPLISVTQSTPTVLACLGGTATTPVVQSCSGPFSPYQIFYDAKRTGRISAPYDVCNDFYLAIVKLKCSTATRAYFAQYVNGTGNLANLYFDHFAAGRKEFWFPRYGLSICYGQFACKQAYRYLVETGDTNGALRIGFQYCTLDVNAAVCGQEKLANDAWYASYETLIVVLGMGVLSARPGLVTHPMGPSLDSSDYPWTVEGQTPYSAGNSLVSEAQRFRQASNFIDGNVAVATGLNPITKLRFFRVVRNVPQGKHSEVVLIESLTADGIESATIDGVYSELQPCNFNFSQCSAKTKLNFPNAKVSWSFDYPTKGNYLSPTEAALDKAIRISSIAQLRAAVIKVVG